MKSSHNLFTVGERRDANAHAKKLIEFGASSLGRPDPRPAVQASRRSIPAMHRMFEEMSVRAQAINPGLIGESMKTFCSEAQEAIETEGWLAARAEVLTLAARGDKDAQFELAEIVRRTCSSLLIGHGGWSAFFEQQTLKNEDQAYLEFSTKREIKFETVGQDGGLRSVQADLDKLQYPCQLHWLWSQEVEYQLIDIYKGSVADLALATIDLARDLAAKMNALCGAYILAGAANSRIGNFVTDGSPDAHYIAHSLIDVSNLPTSNLLVPSSGNTATSYFRLDNLNQLLEYVASWGTGAFEDGDLKLEGIYLASKNSADWVKQVGLGSYTNSIVEQVFSGGGVINYAGMSIPIVGDNTIPATGAGYAYARFNKPIGVMFDKPGMDVIDTKENARKNKGSIAQGRVFGFGMPRPWGVNIAAMKYRG